MAREREKWAEQQIAVLVERGFDAADAQRSVAWVLDNVPDGVEPDAWHPTAAEMRESAASAEAITDSRADWYASEHVAPKYKRILDARSESNE